jgi:hypothetical protein
MKFRVPDCCILGSLRVFERIDSWVPSRSRSRFVLDEGVFLS